MSPLVPQISFLSLRNLIQITLLVLGVGLLLIYGGYQARFFLLGPQVTLSEVPDSPTNTQVIELSGQAQNIVEITLNGMPVYTDTDGSFTERVILHEGLNTLTIEARDRFNRITTIHKEYVYQKETTTENGTTITHYKTERSY